MALIFIIFPGYYAAHNNSYEEANQAGGSFVHRGRESYTNNAPNSVPTSDRKLRWSLLFLYPFSPTYHWKNPEDLVFFGVRFQIFGASILGKVGELKV